MVSDIASTLDIVGVSSTSVDNSGEFSTRNPAGWKRLKGSFSLTTDTRIEGLSLQGCE
jgi:hypothetical protein